MGLEMGKNNLAIMKRTSQLEYAKYRHDFEKCDAATVSHVVDAMAKRLECSPTDAQALLAQEGWRSSFQSGARPEQALMSYSSTHNASADWNAPLPPGATSSRLGGFRDF